MWIELLLNVKINVSNSKSVCIENKFRVRLKSRRRMAIALWTPPEYGPPPPQNPDAGSFVQDANNNNTGRREQPSPPPPANSNRLANLLVGFVTEVLGVVGQRTPPPVAAPQSLRERRNVAVENVVIREDNQPEAPVVPDLIPAIRSSLPDVVCSADVSFRYNRSSRPPVAPLSPASNQLTPRTMDFEVNFKLSLGAEESQDSEDVPDAIPLSPAESYVQAGRSLRLIADSFEQSRSTSRSSSPTSIELRIVIKLAIPTVALAALGLAILRR